MVSRRASADAAPRAALTGGASSRAERRRGRGSPPQAAAAHLLHEPDATTAPLRTTNMSSGLQQGSKAAMKAAASDGVPHHKSEGAAPATKTKGDGHSRNILRKGGPAVERKAGTSGHALQDPSMEGAPPVDPGDPNFESPDDPERVSSKD